MLPRIIPNLRLNETNEFQDDLAQPILIGEHKGDPQNSLDHLLWDLVLYLCMNRSMMSLSS